MESTVDPFEVPKPLWNRPLCVVRVVRVVRHTRVENGLECLHTVDHLINIISYHIY